MARARILRSAPSRAITLATDLEGPPLDRPTRSEALRTLQLPGTADDAAVKSAYRRLVREHHPDRGGDPAAFQQLQRAYERLSDPNAPVPPPLVRGRPSRPPAGVTDPTAADLGSVRWDADPGTGERRLDRDEVAVWLAAPAAGPVRALRATSRAPGSRVNGVARMLAGDLTAQLLIGPTRDDRGREVVAVEVRAGTRKARRVLDRAPLGGIWQRTRSSSSTVLRCDLVPSDDRRATAVRAVDRIQALLDRLDWPLGDWTRTASER